LTTLFSLLIGFSPSYLQSNGLLSRIQLVTKLLED
jgi:hypothetical protein